MRDVRDGIDHVRTDPSGTHKGFVGGEAAIVEDVVDGDSLDEER